MAEQIIDLRPQYAAIVNQKRDGRFLLYAARDGTKVFLPVKGGQPAPLYFVDSGGAPVANSYEKDEGDRCYVCRGTRKTNRCYRIVCPAITK